MSGGGSFAPGIPRPAELTVADVLAELERIGADPATTTFQTSSGPIMRLDGEYEISRDGGAVVVDLRGPMGGCYCDLDCDDEDENDVDGGNE